MDAFWVTHAWYDKLGYFDTEKQAIEACMQYMKERNIHRPIWQTGTSIGMTAYGTPDKRTVIKMKPLYNPENPTDEDRVGYCMYRYKESLKC